jgi:predicted nucleic acid-binding protein
MSEIVLMDTSGWICYLRRGADPAIVRQVQEWLNGGQAAITEVIKLELLPASRTEAEFLRLSARLDALPQLTPDAAVWDAAARNGFALRRAGVIVPTADLLIATVAQQFGALLAHSDQHYERMAPHLALRTVSFLPRGMQPPT